MAAWRPDDQTSPWDARIALEQMCGTHYEQHDLDSEVVEAQAASDRKAAA